MYEDNRCFIEFTWSLMKLYRKGVCDEKLHVGDMQVAQSINSTINNRVIRKDWKLRQRRYFVLHGIFLITKVTCSFLPKQVDRQEIESCLVSCTVNEKQ